MPPRIMIVVIALLDDLMTLLVRDLDGLQREIALYPDDAGLWTVVPGVTNSAGNLALHVAGNIQHFIGARIGGLRYTRDRDNEFGRREGTRDEVIEELARALAVVRQVLPTIADPQLDVPFEVHAGQMVSTRRFLLHLSTHAAFHLGQVGYLRRIVTGDPRSTNAVSASRLT